MGSSVVVHLIRHEKTNANIKRQYIGWTDESIVAKNLCYTVPIHPKVVYGSDLKRCVETSKIYFPSVKYVPIHNLREINFGSFELKTYDDLKNNPIYRAWINDPEMITPPGGENFLSFKLRVIDSFLSIVNQPGEYTFVVHGGVIKILLSVLGPEINFRKIVVNHRTIYSLKWPNVTALRGGLRCKSLSEEPIMGKGNM